MNNSLYSLDFTYHYSKYSCIREFYFIHVVFCYIVFISGLIAFITRLNSKIKFLHHWFGKLYILSMLYATSSSLVIHNTGLPEAVLISFIYIMIGITFGWVLITVHKLKLEKKALTLISNEIHNEIYNLNFDIKTKIINKKTDINNKKKCINRFFSLKAFHGIFMFLSWFNIAGRIFASNQSGDFTCYTYPVYKPIQSEYGHTSNMNLTKNKLKLVSVYDPEYNRLPWAKNELFWNMITLFTPILFGFIVNLIWSLITTKKNKNRYFK